nr:hypothetical protein [Tanacetum cinerariifolium]
GSYALSWKPCQGDSLNLPDHRSCGNYGVWILDIQDSIDTQTCKLSKEEFSNFLTLNPIPYKYRVILPKSNQTIFDASPGGFRGSLKPELFVVHPGSVASRIKDRKCKTRGGSSRPPVKRKLACLLNVLELKDATACNLKISVITHPAWKNHLDDYIDLELLDLHDCCYARQAVIDNAVNRRSRELLQVIEKLRAECDVMRSNEKAREEECEGMRVKCEAAMTEFKKNPAVVALREKISILSLEVKEHKLNLDRMMLESQKWACYQQSLLTLELKDTSLEAEKARLEAVKVSLRKEVEASKDLDTPTFPLLDKFVADPSAPIKALLSKKPLTLHRPSPSRTQVPLPSSQRATPSSVPISNPMSSPTGAFIVKPQSSQPH